MMRILVSLLLLIPELYIWWHFLRDSHWALKSALFLPWLAVSTMLILAQTSLVRDWMFRYAMIIMLIFIIPMILFMLISCVGWALRMFSPVMWRVMNGVGIAVVVATMGIIGYGTLVGWKQLAVNEVELKFKDLPDGFDGYRIVLLSDMHIGTYAPAPECVAHVVDKVNELKPDMICFAGDLVNSSPQELDTFMTDLRRMKAKDGVYSIMGNHDYCTYHKYDHPMDNKRAIEELQRRQRSMGWNLLLNENRIIKHNGDSLMLAGVENSSKPPFPDYGNLTKALKGGDDVAFKILLSHDPTHWQRKVLKETDVQLQMSGHTHATQFRMFGWSPASFTYKEYAGLYEMLPDGKETLNPEHPVADSRKLYVSSGVGENVAFRFGVLPEIVVITLRKDGNK